MPLDPLPKRGLALYESDFYAILGIPVFATAAQIQSTCDRLVKVLNPTYRAPQEDQTLRQTLYRHGFLPSQAVLGDPIRRREYDAILKLQIRQIPKDAPLPWEWMRQLLQSGDPASLYGERVNRQAHYLYQDLEQAPGRIGGLSDLNLGFLLIHTGTITADDVPPPPPPPSPPPPPVPTLAQKRFDQALDLLAIGSNQDAIHFLTLAIAADPQHLRYYLYRARTYEKLGQQQAACADYRTVLSLQPHHRVAQAGVMTCCRSPVPPPDLPSRPWWRRWPAPNRGS